MKKKECKHGFDPCLYRILLKMKLTVLTILLTVLGTWAKDSYSQSARISLDLENASIEEVLNKIEEESEFRFFYNGTINVD